jgi:hypothetical protein
MTSLRALRAAVALAALSLPASAQYSGSMNGPLADEWLLGLDLAYSYEERSGPEHEALTLGASLSRFLAREHQLGLELRTRYEAIEAGGHAGELFVGPLYNYTWYPAERTALYLGLRAGAAYEDVTGAGDDTHFAWGAQAGLRQWLTPRTALGIEPRWTRYEIDGPAATERDRFDVLIGLHLVL